jgi:hypothetical protein
MAPCEEPEHPIAWVKLNWAVKLGGAVMGRVELTAQPFTSVMRAA